MLSPRKEGISFPSTISVILDLGLFLLEGGQRKKCKKEKKKKEEGGGRNYTKLTWQTGQPFWPCVPQEYGLLVKLELNLNMQSCGDKPQIKTKLICRRSLILASIGS